MTIKNLLKMSGIKKAHCAHEQMEHNMNNVRVQALSPPVEKLTICKSLAGKQYFWTARESARSPKPLSTFYDLPFYESFSNILRSVRRENIGRQGPYSPEYLKKPAEFLELSSIEPMQTPHEDA